jgi:hypothetical protein
VSRISDRLMRNGPPFRPSFFEFNQIRYELQPGDVLLIQGRHPISRFIQKVTQSPWSQAALYIGKLYDIDDPRLQKKIGQYFTGPSDNSLLFASMLGKGTLITPLTYYRHDPIRICRPKGLSRSEVQRMISYAVSRLGDHCTTRYVVDLARFLLSWQYFRRSYTVLFKHTSSQVMQDIFSSIIADAFHSIHFPIIPLVREEGDKRQPIQKKSRHYTPSDFDYSPYFDIIKP